MTLADRLREIKDRCEKATKGPWQADDVFEHEGECLRVALTDTPTEQIRSTVAICSYDDDAPRREREIGLLGAVANADFIAHAREDIPFLLAELDRLTQERERLETELAEARRKEA